MVRRARPPTRRGSGRTRRYQRHGDLTGDATVAAGSYRHAAATAAIAPPSASATAAAAIASRRRADPSFNRLRQRAARPQRPRGRDPAARPGDVRPACPLRPYSARVREAQSVRDRHARPQPRVGRQPPTAQSSRNYYPAMRTGRHPNANVPVVSGSARIAARGWGWARGHGRPARTPQPAAPPWPAAWAEAGTRSRWVPRGCVERNRHLTTNGVEPVCRRPAVLL